MIKRLAIGALLTTTIVSDAEIVPHLIEDKFFLQTGERSTTYIGGQFFTEFNDGTFTINPDPLIPPDALVLQGDSDGDGASDAFTFLSLTSVIETTELAPFELDKVRLFSAPVSDLPRPNGGFVDYSFIVQWDYDDLLNLREYVLAGYRAATIYTGGASNRSLHDRQIVPGDYTFELPVFRGLPSERHYRSISVAPMPEVYPGRTQSPLPSGFRFTNPMDSDGTIQIDPRIPGSLTWEGINSLTILNDDRVTISFYNTQRGVYDRRSAIPEVLDPVIIPIANLPFPTISLPSPQKFEGSYAIPPTILLPADLTVPTTIFAELRVERGNPNEQPFPVGHIANRSLQIRIKLIDSYAGFANMLASFDNGEDRSPGADPDGDGFSNLIEYAMGSDPSDATSTPDVTPVDLGGGAPGTFVVTALGDGRCNVSLTKRPNVGDGLTYFIEHSEDMLTWTRIPIGGNADWVENTNNDTTLEVTSAAPIVGSLVSGCFFRVAVELNN